MTCLIANDGGVMRTEENVWGKINMIFYKNDYFFFQKNPNFDI